MKKFILSSLTLVLALVSLSSFAFTRCDTSDSNAVFCQCYMNNYNASCTKYLPPALCAHTTVSTVKSQINSMGGATASCNIQRDDPDKNECIAATNHFLNHC